MAKRGQKIDELYISLGLDIAQLQLDFDTAGKTVSQAIARLNSKDTQLKLQMDVDLAKLDGVGTELDQLKVKYQAINRELDVQRQKEEILAAVLKDAQKNNGADSDAAARATTNLLKQQKVVAQTEAEVRKLNVAMKNLGGTVTTTTTKGGAFGSVLTASIATAKGGVTSLTSGFNLLSAKAAAAMAILSTGAGLFTLTKSAMEAGENTYRLTKRLHATAAEAGVLNRTFQLAGTDVMSVIPLLARLDKQVEQAGISGNDTTKAMERFGVSLLDQTGNLLPLNEQLGELAKGYQKALDAGQEESFTAEVLGARGAGLTPLLEQYEDLSKIAASVKTTGLLNPEEAHKTWLEWKQMEMELGQLKSAFGTALLPVASELMPSVTAAFREMVELIRDNKDSIKSAVMGWGTVLKSVAEILVFIGEQVDEVSEHSKANSWLMDNHPVASALIPIPFLGGAILDSMYGDEYKAYQEEQKALAEKAKAEKLAAAESEKNNRAQEETTASAKKRAEAEKLATKAVAESTKANKDLTRSLYAVKHNDFENAMMAVQNEAEDLREKGADNSLVNQYMLAKQSKIYKDFQQNVVASAKEIYNTDLQNRLDAIDREGRAYKQKGLDEVSTASWVAASKAKVMEEWENEVASKIDSVWKTELQNRLDDIEREKQAWIKKGLDEVKATEWAEKEKLDAKRSAALQVLQSQKEEFRAYLEGGQRGLADYYKEAHGFSMDDLAMTPEQLAGFQQARKDMLENLLPNFRDPAVIAQEKLEREQSFRMIVDGKVYGYNDLFGGMGSELNGLREEMDKLNAVKSPSANGAGVATGLTDNRQVTVQVNIQNAVTQDNDGMRLLADSVADRIRPAVENALGGGDNSYSNW